jgi:hypothetical protein
MIYVMVTLGSVLICATARIVLGLAALRDSDSEHRAGILRALFRSRTDDAGRAS